MSTRLACLLALAAVWPSSSFGYGTPKPEVRTGTVDVEGGSLYYEEAGKGSPVVFIHGGFGDRRMWDEQFSHFAGGHRVIRYDHRGYGESPAPGSAYSPVDDLVRLLDRLGVERAHIVGNSMGATLALDFTLKHPERVASLTMVSSGPGGFPVPPKDREGMMAVFEAARAKGPAEGVELWLGHPMVAVTSRDPKAGPRLRTLVTDNMGLFSIAYWPREAMDPPALDRLGEVRVPTLVVVGDRDMTFIQDGCDAAAKGIAGAKKVVIRGADHLPQMLKPSEFNRALEKFLDGVKP